MIEVKLDITNEGAEAAKNEIRSFLAHMDRKMAGDIPDRKGTAARGYVVLRNLLGRIEECQHILETENLRALKKAAPTIREEWDSVR